MHLVCPPKFSITIVFSWDSLRSMAVLSSRAQERRSRQIRARSARERAAKPREKVASAPISSRFLCPRPPLLLRAPNQNRHATQATLGTTVLPRRNWKQWLSEIWGWGGGGVNNVHYDLCKNGEFSHIPFVIERFHPRGQHICKVIGINESIYIRKRFISHRIFLKH